MTTHLERAKIDEIADPVGFVADYEGVWQIVGHDRFDHVDALAGQGITVLVSTHYMDEAERCHEIAYIAYGKLMARGTAEEIIASSGLAALVATGPGADRLAPLLRDVPGVTAAAAFGTALHVCGPDRDALWRAVTPFRDRGITWEEATPTLEDVFIHLMGQATDNMEAA